MIGKIVSPYLKKKLLGTYLKQNRTVKLQTLKNAKNVGILWNPSDETGVDSYEQLRKVLKEKGIKIVGIAYISSEREKDTLTTVAHSWFLSKKEVSFLGKPKSSEALQFMQQPFDILIDLSIKKTVPLLHLLINSLAQFKVGWKANDYNFYDLNVDVSDKPECKYLMEQIIYYLDKIKEKGE
jgi:hypothetical protein